MTLKVKYVKRTNEKIEKEEFEKLIGDFNLEANFQGCKYKIIMKYDYPHLIQGWWFFENYSNQITKGYDGTYNFVDEISEERLEEIKQILEEIPQTFEIEVEKAQK